MFVTCVALLLAFSVQILEHFESKDNSRNFTKRTGIPEPEVNATYELVINIPVSNVPFPCMHHSTYWALSHILLLLHAVSRYLLSIGLYATSDRSIRQKGNHHFMHRNSIRCLLCFVFSNIDICDIIYLLLFDRFNLKRS